MRPPVDDNELDPLRLLTVLAGIALLIGGVIACLTLVLWWKGILMIAGGVRALELGLLGHRATPKSGTQHDQQSRQQRDSRWENWD